MWTKLPDHGEARQGRLPVPVPMLEANIEALSEFSLTDDLKTSLQQSLKKNEKCYITVCVMVVLMVPLLVLLVMLEVRRFDRIRSEPTVIVDGSLQVAMTSCGPVQGLAEDGGLHFRGIPYAVPPVGGNRWKPGRTPDRLEHCWQGVLQYPEQEPEPCLQMERLADGRWRPIGREDCLTLDVFTPRVGYDSPSKVVVVVAAPSLAGGWPDSSIRDQAAPTARLAREKDVVFVVPRFRMGPLGFLPRLLLNDTRPVIKNSSGFTDAVIAAQRAHVDLDRSYNLGLTDLVAALVWVQRNIEHLGGDPSVVTLFGWAAGASLVTSLTTMPPPRGHSFLFTQVWVTGGGGSPGAGVATPEAQRVAAGLELWVNSPCAASFQAYDPFCLLALPAATLMSSVPASWLNNDAGHQWLLPDRFWWQRTAESAWSDVQPADGKDFPLVVGATSHAAVKARCIDARAEDEIKAALERLHGERAVAYDNATSTASRASLLSQRRVVCPLWRLARTAADAFSSAVSFYVASEPRAQPPCSNGGRPRSLELADSLSDVSAILGRYPLRRPADVQYVAHMQDLFYDFLTDGVLTGAVSVGAGVYDVAASGVSWNATDRSFCSLWKDDDAGPAI